MIKNTVLPIIKRIYIKLGGNASDVENMTTIAPVLNLIVDKIKSGYSDFTDKPQINGEILDGNKSSSQLKINAMNYLIPEQSVVSVSSLEKGVYNVADSFILSIGREQINLQKGAVLCVDRNPYTERGCIFGGTDGGVIAYSYTQGHSPIIKNLADMPNNSVLIFKGVKATVDQLPSSGNTIGDVWAVTNDNSEHVWINDGNTEKWIEFGQVVDLSAYATKVYVDDAIPTSFKTVASLPLTNIDDTARYLIKNNKLFPSAARLIDNTYNTIVVKHDELHDEWKLLRSTGIWYYFSSYKPLSFTYEIYTLNTAGTEWVIETPETTDSNWSVAMGFGAKLSQFDATGILFSTHDIGTALQGIEDFRYRTTSNVADIYGASTSGEPVYTFLTWKHSTGGWTMLGVTDLTDILKPIDDAIAEKLDNSSVKQTTGSSTTDVMSQKAVSDALENCGITAEQVQSMIDDALADIHPVSLDENGLLTCSVDDDGDIRTFVLQGKEKGTDNPLIPPLTSNSGTNGYVICSNTYSGGDSTKAYYAFDNNTGTKCYYTSEDQSGGYVGYMFDREVTIRKMVAYLGNFRTSNSFTVKPQYYHDGAWVDFGQDFIVTGYSEGNYGVFELVFRSTQATGFRLLFPDTKISNTNIMTYGVQIYS